MRAQALAIGLAITLVAVGCSLVGMAIAEAIIQGGV